MCVCAVHSQLRETVSVFAVLDPLPLNASSPLSLAAVAHHQQDMCLRQFFDNGCGIRWKVIEAIYKRLKELHEDATKLDGFRCVLVVWHV